MKEKGFILITLLLLLTLAAVTAFSLNGRTGMQLRMTGNDTLSLQGYLDRLAVSELSRWSFLDNIGLRVSNAAIDYNGTRYTRTVANATVANYTDALRIAVASPGGARPLAVSLRYYSDTPFAVRQPYQIAVDRWDNVYFADSLNNMVWKISAASGAIAKIAGTGIVGYGGDSGPATMAQLSSPLGVCVDGLGNVYISDTGNHRIRKIDISGVITTVAGTGTAGYNNDGIPATSAYLKNPQGIAVDSANNLYIADCLNNRIRKVDASSPFHISTVAGNGESGLSGEDPLNPTLATEAMISKPQGVAVDGQGNIFFADTGNGRIRKVPAQSPRYIVRVAGGGSDLNDKEDAVDAKLNNPQGVFVDGAGNIFIADSNQQRIRKVTTDGKIDTVAGTGAPGYTGDGGPAISAKIKSPFSMAVKSTGELVIADTMNSSVRQVDTANIISTLSAMALPGLSAAEQVAPSYDPATNKTYLYIADTGNNQIRRLDPETNAVSTVAGTGISGSSGDGGPAADAKFFGPKGLFANANRDLFIADTGNNRIHKVTAATGIITTVAGSGVSGNSGDNGSATLATMTLPQGIVVDGSGNLFIADTGNHQVRKVTAASGIITTVVGNGSAGLGGDGGPATAAKLNSPQGVAVNAAGDLFIADTLNCRIRKVAAADGRISTVAGSGTGGGYSGDGGSAQTAKLSYPEGISTDGAGNLYIADTLNHAIRVVNVSNGIISTLAGIALFSGFNGDNLPAAATTLKAPTSAVTTGVKGGGTLYISDTGQNRIRKLSLKTVKELY